MRNSKKLLLSYSGTYVSSYDLKKHKLRNMEEATVSYFAENYRKSKNLGYHKSYADLTEPLYLVNEKLKLFKTDLDFAKALINVDLKDRFNWLQANVTHAMMKDKEMTTADLIAVLAYLERELR